VPATPVLPPLPFTPLPLVPAKPVTPLPNVPAEPMTPEVKLLLFFVLMPWMPAPRPLFLYTWHGVLLVHVTLRSGFGPVGPAIAGFNASPAASAPAATTIAAAAIVGLMVGNRMISSSLKSCGVPGDMGSPKTVTVEM